MIELKNVTKKFSKKIAVNDISLNVNKGEILGFLGPNGAGKTTTMRMITGSLSTTSGSIKIGGFDILDSPCKAKSLIGYLPETPPIYPEMTVQEYLSFAGKIKQVPRAELSERLNHVLNACSISDVRKRLIKNLSKGYKQRIGIASALIHNPPILILDEPTIGLDPKQIIEIRNLIKSLAKNHTVILSTHILSEVSLTCSKVIIINHGKIVAEDAHKNLANNLDERNMVRVKLKTPPTDKTQIFSKLKEIDGVIEVKHESGDHFTIETPTDIDVRDLVAEKIVSNSWGLLEMNSQNMTLEDIYLKLTQSEASI
jgi:ABC-2 type transport system ATP-binding protein